MAFRSTPDRWGSLTRVLHWLMFALLLGIIPVGFFMSDLPLGAQKMKLYALHKSVGITILGLAALRLAWRATEHRPAAAPMPPWQTWVAGLTQLLMYALLFAIPLSGWVYNSAAGFPLPWFGLVRLPALVHADPALKAAAKEVHEAGVWLLMVLVALHIGGALKHHFVDRDDTLRAMLPFGGRR